MTKKTVTVQRPTRNVTRPQTAAKPMWELPVYVVGAIFIGLTLIFFGSQLFGSTYFWEDFLEYVYPVQTFAAREWLASGIPFWNPFSFAGMPFIADLQVGFFYPLNRILSLFVSGNTLPVAAMEFVIILHFIISLFNMYFLSRYWKISTYGSVIAAISYSFSMLLVCHVIHPMIVYHLAWLPLVTMLFLIGIDKLKIRYAILSGLIFGMSFLSGHPQMTLYAALFLGFLFIWKLVAKLKNKEVPTGKIPTLIISGVIPFVIAVGIFAIQYFPSKELADMSIRADTSYEKSTEGSLEFKHAYAAVVPKIFGYVDGANQNDPTYFLKSRDKFIKYNYWETAFYFGLTALVMGLFGALVHYKSRLGAMMIFFALFGMMFALGENGFLYGIFYHLPFFGTFRNPGRMLFMTIMAFSIFTGLAFDSLRTNLKNKEYTIKLLIAAAIPLLIAVLAATGALSSAFDAPALAAQDAATYGQYAVGFIALIVVVSWLLNRGLLAPSLAGLILAATAFLDLYIEGGSFNKSTVNPAEVYTLNPELKKQFTPNLPSDPFRVNTRMYQPVSVMAMQRNQGMIDRIMLVEGYNPLILDRVQPPVQTREGVNNFYNVRYAVQVDMQRGSMYFSQNDSAYPRAWVVHKAEVFGTEELKNKMKFVKYDYQHEVLLEEQPGITLPQTVIDSVKVEKATCTEYTNNSIGFTVNTPQAGMMVFSEIWYPAWKAYVDGKQTPVLRADYSFRAIALPAGNHKVEMRYESDTYNTGRNITIVTLLASLIGFGLTFVFKKGKSKDDNTEI